MPKELESVEANARVPTAAAALTGTDLNTFNPGCLEIDQLGPTPPPDANLFVGNDPADQSMSRKFPTSSSCPSSSTFIDWQDLGSDLANHRLLDCPGDPAQCVGGKDPTSFPRSNECVGTSAVLSKMDLTYAAASSNTDFAYFAVQRANNNGDAAYYWLFTQKEPTLAVGASPCRADEKRLTYTLTGLPSSTRDVLLVGHFHPSGEPLLQVYRAKNPPATALSAVQAIDFTNTTLWEPHPDGVAAVAVNTTITAPGAFGSTGVLALSGQNLQSEIFAEAAVPKSVFTGGSSCGASFFGSVISRSSGSGGTSPDLKDLLGPAKFNFGSISATAALTPTCGLAFGYSASATGTNGAPITNPTCSWNCNGTTFTGCSGTQPASVGTQSCTVTVTDPASGCVAAPIDKTVRVCSPLTVSASMTATCSSSFNYGATPSGGCGDTGREYSWSFSGPCAPSPTSSSTQSGTGTAGSPGNVCNGALVARDTRTDIATCTANASASATPLRPLSVAIAPTPASLMCPMNSDAITFSSTVSGGNGNYVFTWNGPMCSGTSCTVDPSNDAFCFDKDVSLTVSDTSMLCPPATSNGFTYTKRTTVTATPAPAPMLRAGK